MDKWTISCPMVFRENYTVEADTYEEAVELIMEDQGEHVDDTLNFSSWMDPEEAIYMVLEGPTNEDGQPYQ